MRQGARQTADSKAHAALDILNSLDPLAPRSEQAAVLKKALADRHFLVVARAATLCGEKLFHELIADLQSAFARFVPEAVKRDPRCKAKSAIARALLTLECLDIEFYQTGILYRQLEPVWGGRADTATDIRCSCAMGLAASGHLRAVAELAGLLNDPEVEVRCGAARAISCGNPFEAEAVLRLKVLIGDAEPQVTGECFGALLAIAPQYSLAFVAGFLRVKDELLQEYAALALGESRQPEALTLLRGAWDELVSPEARGALIRAAALHRSEPAFEWLLNIIETGTAKLAGAAADALAVYERNTKLIEQIKAAQARRID
ncbi:MAG: HEAT repeat domain-containing protein [Steroidobacteraceae bacterium]